MPEHNHSDKDRAYLQKLHEEAVGLREEAAWIDDKLGINLNAFQVHCD